MYIRKMAKPITAVLIYVFFLAAAAQAKTGAMTVALPADVIKQSLQDILPLKLDQPNQYLEGILILTSIDKLLMGDNSAVVQGLILGKDLAVITQVGNQDLRIKVGNLYLPLTCDLFFRFDPKSKQLFVKPQIRNQPSGSANDMAGSVASMLTAFNNREYPVSLTSFQTLTAKVGNQDIFVNMVPVDIKVAKGQLIVKMLPKLRKSKAKTN